MLFQIRQLVPLLRERSILTKLKQQCGAQFTSKMEGMVTDLQLARDNQARGGCSDCLPILYPVRIAKLYSCFCECSSVDPSACLKKVPPGLVTQPLNLLK